MGIVHPKSRQKKMTKKNRIKFPEKKIPNPATTTQNNPKKSLNYKKICHTPQFFFTSNEQDTRKKKNNQKTKQAREKEIMFLFLTPRFRKKTNNKQLLSLLSSEKTKTTTKKIPKKFPLPQYFKMMVLLLYIQNQDKKNDQKKIES